MYIYIYIYTARETQRQRDRHNNLNAQTKVATQFRASAKEFVPRANAEAGQIRVHGYVCFAESWHAAAFAHPILYGKMMVCWSPNPGESLLIQTYFKTYGLGDWE